MAPKGAALWRTLHTHQIYGANTNVGKTVVSTLLCKVLSKRGAVGFLKPVSTGSLEEADDRHVERFTTGANVLTKCLYQFDEPVSPHIAARSKTKTVPADNDIISSIHSTLSSWSANGVTNALVETAGGVHSPGPNANSQADLYRPLRLPVVLVADSRLGGISSSISAYESLLLRGYDIHSVLLFEDDYYQNHEYLRTYFANKAIPLLTLPKPPLRPEGKTTRTTADDQARDLEAMTNYYDTVATQSDIGSILDEMEKKSQDRITTVESMATRAHNAIWYPFTQHQGMQPKDITVIESAYGDYFQTLNTNSIDKKSTTPVLKPTFDGSASWWTQGLGHGNPELALTAAHAAGKYGHVMFAGAVHEPALNLAELLLQSLGNERLSKVFYTDNGSTGMEVAVKMALRAACVRYGWQSSSQSEVKILGLKGSYHGDTIGVMDCSEPSTFNQKVEWYRGRGHWFDFPTVGMKNGRWRVTVPGELNEELGNGEDFESLDDVFDLEKRAQSAAGKRYSAYIKGALEDLVYNKGVKFGALIMEPVILGAGGMLFADPLFQYSLANVVRSNPRLFGATQLSSSSSDNSRNWSGLPIIFDEVFTGLYRLGRRTSASFLGIDADISVHAKLLTGGLIPLAVTLASKDIFDSFSSPEKSDALLHGHSYTAHAVGCQVAETSVREMIDMEKRGDWDAFKTEWKTGSVGPTARGNVWSYWSASLLQDLSRAKSVESVFAIGSVFSVTLRDQAGQGGYTSTAAQGLQQKLILGEKTFNVHSRVLGNVLYLMASMTSKPEELRRVEGLLRDALL